MQELQLKQDQSLKITLLKNREKSEKKTLLLYHSEKTHNLNMTKNTLNFTLRPPQISSNDLQEESNIVILVEKKNYNLIFTEKLPEEKQTKDLFFIRKDGQWQVHGYQPDGKHKTIKIAEDNRLHYELEQKDRNLAIIEFLTLCILHKRESAHFKIYALDMYDDKQSFSFLDIKSRLQNYNDVDKILNAILKNPLNTEIGEEAFSLIKKLRLIAIKIHLKSLLEKEIAAGTFGYEIQKIADLAAKFNTETETFNKYFSTNSPQIEFLSKLKEIYPAIDLNKFLLPYNKGLQFYADGPLVNIIPNTNAIDSDNNIDLEWDTAAYFKENRYKVEINEFLKEMESRKGRIYFSNIFPSGLHRHHKNNRPEDKERNNILKNNRLPNEETYTVASFLQFGFGQIGERLYTLEEKIHIINNAVDYFIIPTNEKGRMNSFEREKREMRDIYFLDTSNNTHDKVSHFYGYATIRLLDDGYIVSTESHRIMRIERNYYRYQQLKELLNHKKNNFPGKYLLKMMQETLLEWQKKKMNHSQALELFLQKLNGDYLTICRNNCNPR